MTTWIGTHPNTNTVIYGTDEDDCLLNVYRYCLSTHEDVPFCEWSVAFKMATPKSS